MTAPQPTARELRRELLLGLARGHDDTKVRDVVQLLEEDLAESKREKAALERQLSETRFRWFRDMKAGGRVIMAFIVAFAVAVGIMWWQYGTDPAAFRRGLREGYADGKAARLHAAVGAPASERVQSESSAVGLRRGTASAHR
jgi:hypothetical protein